MKIILSIALTACLFFGHGLAEGQQQAKSEKEKASYSLGYNAGSLMNKSMMDIDPDVYSKAFKEGLAGHKADMTDQEMREVIQEIQKNMKAKSADRKKKLSEGRKQLSEKNKKEGEDFLARNAGKDGVVTLPSGLQYRVIKDGAGKQPSGADTVAVNYRGTLIDGAEFDSSFKNGKPASFGVAKVIKGWTEALMLMKEGSKWMLYVPSNLAYGERGAGGKIGPNQTLIFEVELLSVQ